ncbi:MAG: formate dehydrogenase accessory sulfurtransferase FdhD [Colwellia sp.]
MMSDNEKTPQNAGHQEHTVRVFKCNDEGEHTTQKLDNIIEECAVALIYNGISHAVMMATPVNLEAFALGFSLSEGIVTQPSQVYDIHCDITDKGIEVHIEISSQQMSALKQHRRNLVGRTGCGLCGSESLEQAIRPVNSVQGQPLPTALAIQNAIKEISKHQLLQALTGGVHGAAWCLTNGEIQCLFEDVGRHNALDKLIGHLASEKINKQEGFALISSRASYEMIHKVSSVNIPSLVAVSAPTTLAIKLAKTAGLNLVGFARPDRHVVYTNSSHND